jgi:hypothetical protein
MADWPSLYGDCTKTQSFGEFSPATSTKPVQFNAGSDHDQKGAWAELTTVALGGPLAFDAHALLVTISLNAGIKGLVDVGIGSPPTAIVQNLLVQQPSYQHCLQFYLPVSAGAAVPISLRCQMSMSGGVAAYGMATAISQGFLPPAGFTACETIGVDTGTTSGTVIDPGAQANTKGTAVSVGVLTRPCSSVLLAIGGQAKARLTGRYFLDIMLSDGTIVLPDLALAVNSSSDLFGQAAIGPIPLSLPIDNFIFARAQSSLTTVGTREFELAMYCFG